MLEHEIDNLLIELASNAPDRLKDQDKLIALLLAVRNNLCDDPSNCRHCAAACPRAYDRALIAALPEPTR